VAISKDCKIKECGVSTGIHDGLTFGGGRLDEWGYFKHPCDDCAREWERLHPEDAPCWPWEIDELDRYYD
jgi:hypothetical protein